MQVSARLHQSGQSNLVMFITAWATTPTVAAFNPRIHPACDLHYKFDGGTPPALDTTILDEMNVQSVHARGIELTEAELAKSADHRS